MQHENVAGAAGNLATAPIEEERWEGKKLFYSTSSPTIRSGSKLFS
jgi:hypothetical protein